MVDASALRERLIALRVNLLAQLAAGDRLDVCYLTTMAGIAATLAALAADAPADAVPADTPE